MAATVRVDFPLPAITMTVNLSLATSTFPSQFKSSFEKKNVTTHQ